LSSVAEDLHIPLHVVCPNGILDERFVASWERKLDRMKRENDEGANLEPKANLLNPDEDEDENDSLSDDAKACENPKSDECSRFIESILTGRQKQRQQQQQQQRQRAFSSPSKNRFLRGLLKVRKKRMKASADTKPVFPNRRLRKRPTLGSEKKMEKFLTHNDKSLKGIRHLVFDNNNASKGEADTTAMSSRVHGASVLTRSKARLIRQRYPGGISKNNNNNNNNNNNDDSNANEIKNKDDDDATRTKTTTTTTSTREKTKKQRHFHDNNKNNNNNNNIDNDDNNSNNSDKTTDAFDIVLNRREKRRHENTSDGDILFSPDCLLIIDDALISQSHLREDKNESVKKKSNNFVRILEFIESLCLEKCHHYHINLIIVSQTNLVSSGNTYVSQLYRSIRTNLDGFVLYQQNISDVRRFLMSLGTGENYRLLKEIYISSIENAMSEHVGESRLSRPYIFYSVNNATNKNLKYR